MKRFEPEVDYTGCYYEADPPSASMMQHPHGEYVLYSEYQALQAKLDALMLEYCFAEMSANQIDNWANLQKPV